MKLTIEQTEYVLRLDTGELTVLRVIEPSAPSGLWPGNEVQIREWEISRKSGGALTPCTDEEIIQLEAAM